MNTSLLHPFVVSLVTAVAGCGGSTFAPPDAGTDAGTNPEGDSGAGTPDTGGGSADGSSATGEAGAGGVTTAGVECGYAYSGYNASASVKATSTVQWTCTSTTRTVTGNGIPDHDVGTFPNSNCPNTISAQSVSDTMTLTPESTGTATPIGVGGIGYAFNGVKFDPGTAGTCTVTGSTASCSLIGNTGAWNIEALGQSSFDFGVDDSNAHVQPTGAYHYHGMPEGILTRLAKGMTPTLVGYARDGFPVYARYGYSSPMDSASAVKVMTGSYQLKATPDAGRPSTSTYPMGAFTQDYEYVAGSGDLDACNGRTDVTPEWPKGIYHYYITDTYPFIQRCVMGTASSTGGGPTGDGGMVGMPEAGASCTSSSSCGSNEVCCPSGQMCAGQCVPDCRVSGSCPSGLTCDTSSGVCTP